MPVHPGAFAATVDRLTTRYLLEGQRGEHAWLSWPSVTAREVIVHVVVRDGTQWRRRRAFRDRLTADPALAAQYEQLKLRLAGQQLDLAAYTRAKAAFVLRVSGL